MDLGIKGRRALVSGGSKGLGRAAARALAGEGVDVTLIARHLETLEKTAAEIRGETGVKVDVIAADVTTPEGRAAVLKACPDPDILVTNPGKRQTPDSFRDLSRADWDACHRAAVKEERVFPGFSIQPFENVTGQFKNSTSQKARQKACRKIFNRISQQNRGRL